MRTSRSTTAATVLRGRVVTPEDVIDDGVVVLHGGLLALVGAVGDAALSPWEEQVRASPEPSPGTTLLPGLVDLHNHGGGGVGFPDVTDAATAQVVIDEHRRHGTTRLVASLVTASPDTLRARIAVLVGLVEAGELAGIHLEGPFLSPARRGAQDPALMRDPDADLTRALLAHGRGHVVTMTVAPELPGITGPDGVSAALVAGGALPSFGHTDASSALVRAAVDDAVSHLSGPGSRSPRATVTHLFNGMRPLHHREPGPVPPLLAAAHEGRLVVELVADGLHLAPELVTDVFSIVGAQSIALVTDAMAAAGMPDGEYHLGSLAVRVSDGVARLVDGGAIASSTAHLIDVVRTTVHGGVALREAVLAASLTPAEVIGVGDIGALRAGYRGDVVVADAGLRPVRVYRDGYAVT